MGDKIVRTNTQNNVDDNIEIHSRYLDNGSFNLVNMEDEDLLMNIFSTDRQVDFDAKFPDFIIKSNLNNLICGIEHFEFNSSRQTRDENSLKIDAARIKRNHDDLLKKKVSKSRNKKIFGVHSHDMLIADPQTAYYFDSFNKGFDKHEKNIRKYRDQLNKLCSNQSYEQLLGFLIEDTSPLGTRTEGDYLQLYPFMVKEIVSKIVSSNALDFVIFADFYQDTSYFASIKTLIKLNSDDLDSILNIKLAPVNPMQISTTVVVKDE